jgi:hypothetical protein
VNWGRDASVIMDELFEDEKPAGSQRAMEALLAMTKLDQAAIRRAYDGA